MHNVIEVNELVREYTSYTGIFKKKQQTLRAIDSISFSVKKGEVFGLLGPNGAGKTTTMKILTTLLAPTSGNVEIFGYKPFGEEKFVRPRINFIYGGERNLYWRITGRENLIYFSDLYKIDKKTRDERIPYLLDLVKLSDRADERVETYSKGMKQRLQIARGLVNDPEIIFLDEPTIGLDPIGARDLRDIIKNLSKLGKTIVITTHYMYEADELCDRIAIINKGKLLALDTPDNLKKVLDSLSVIEANVDFISDDKISEIKSLNGIEVLPLEHLEKSTLVKVQCKEPYKFIGKLINILEEDHILNINTRSTTLEDVYVHYVGGQDV
ncbi:MULTISPECIES: ABC transporter ATP-binding protein [Bacillus cereus group]|uniref:ABC transporter ATP-binding protein n=1 Tax=Bacillus proteolyticus TaxID=2026192 RepID=A0ABV3IFG3_9BACI|nr:ABC transporter ATP-binding protein [Bacillus cereus group sp. N8]MBJ8107565.1 ABC transporter ATP-binding protein [Bacillus cereus group sp. N8]